MNKTSKIIFLDRYWVLIFSCIMILVAFIADDQPKLGVDNLPIVALGCVMVAFWIEQLRTGTVTTLGGDIRRADNPFGYWFFVVLFGGVGFITTWLGISGPLR